MAASAAREFVDGWSLAQILGEGSFAEVRLVINRTTGDAVAMKMIDLSKHPEAKVSVRKEVCIQKTLQHQHVLRLFGQRSQANIEYIFLEYAAGGELFDRIEPDQGMKNSEAQRYFNQLLSGVQYLHTRGVAHRDLKPENLLLDSNDNLKISDFGMATMFRLKGRERLLDKRCGTLPYVAPEVLSEAFYSAEPADIWSCGVILTAMIAGELPWDQPKQSCPEFAAWGSSCYTALTPWTKINNLVLSLVRKILATDPKNRISIENIKKHRWCTMQFSEDEKKTGHDSVDGFPSKRFCSVSGDSGHVAKMSLSQPSFLQKVPTIGQNDIESRADMCFSQPALLDDMILSTQMNLTQGNTQNVFQKLVKRMTRFFVSGESADALKKLSVCLENQGFTWKVNEGVITISTLDRRKMQLVFKANIIDMDGKLLVDFRLSKGCGLEFKRRFVQIKSSLSDIVVKGAVGWPSYS